ncbi:hypothetical protein OV208_04835 [Corallococcus sp. bb12-1]|uniref:hypothetical protein n=1 Tax=Corallococcus sp. bb12-1 TaxID=2996784 RepID=UPI00226F01F1|nr:hypothetical protein [Corallococcus sp. bb12-1]MCY1040639.1 hypothetical protein [Corallococcus sp. bb12-1]
MQVALMVQVYSEWRGDPFFSGQPEEGREVYIQATEAGFIAFGKMNGIPGTIFEVIGTKEERPAFEVQIRSEGAALFIGMPPLDTNTVGDKSDSGTNRPGLRAPVAESAKAAPVPGRTVSGAKAVPGSTQPESKERKADAQAEGPSSMTKEEA